MHDISYKKKTTGTLDTSLDNIKKLYTEMIKNEQKDNLIQFLKELNNSPIFDYRKIYDHIFELLLQKYQNYTKSLKTLLEILFDVSELHFDYAATKILSQNNNDISEFFNELKFLKSKGYKFNVVMINRMMNYCIENINVTFYQFVKTIKNNLSPEDSEMFNKTIHEKFNQREMSRRPIGLPRKK